MEYTPGEILTTEHYQFEATFRQVTSNMHDRIGKSAMHGNYGEDEQTAREMFVPVDPRDKTAMRGAYENQKAEVRDAYLKLAAYDRSHGHDPAVSVILLPPKAILEVEPNVRNRFMEDYAGVRVVDEAQLIIGVSDRWTLAVVQGDLRDGGQRPATHPSYLSHMTSITPLGYAGMGGSIDRQVAPHERHCTELDATVGDEPRQAYGVYTHGGPQSYHGHKILMGGKPTTSEDGLAQITIGLEPPHIKKPFWNHSAPMPVAKRLMYWAGMNA